MSNVFFLFSGEFNVSKFCSTEELRNCILPTTGKSIFLNSVKGVVFYLNSVATQVQLLDFAVTEIIIFKYNF